MSNSLFHFYQDELYFIRKMGEEFAKQYPAAAARLRLEKTRSGDPHVERMIEAFALLSARVQNKLNDEYPELTEAVLNVLYPHYLAPIPSFATVQFDLDPARATPTGVQIPRGGMLATQRVADTTCRYRTCFPLTLWPITVTEAKLQPPPFPPGLSPPDNAKAALRLKLSVQGELPLPMLELTALRLHIAAGLGLAPPLYELIHNHALRVVFRTPDAKGAAPVILPAKDVIKPVGFDLNEGLLPYPRQAFPGYRLLTEFFAYPAKFLYFDLGGWDRVRAAGALKTVEVFIFVDRTLPRLEQGVDADVFRVGCTPVVNLFEQTAEPIALSQMRTEYKIVPDVARPFGLEVYSVETVTAADPDGTDREFRPFYDFRHAGSRDKSTPFWFATRKPGMGQPEEEGVRDKVEDRGTDVFLRLVDRTFDPAAPADSVLIVRTLCTNRDLPDRLPRDADEVRFTAEFAAPGVTLRCPRNPTRSFRPPLRRGQQWRVIAHLNLNHLSLTADDEGRVALQELLRLYDPTDPDVEPQLAALARSVIDGITDLKSRRAMALVEGGYARGTELTVEFDETKYQETSAFLFSAVLERFFALYAGLNSFTQTVARLRGRPGELKRWPPRAGDRPLI
jgi:type VI secretion system protein ImpG